MRTSSNPVFRNLPKQTGGGYASFGSAAAGAGAATQQFGQPAPQPYTTADSQRAMTIDDVVTKTGVTLGVLTVTAIISYVMASNNPSLAPMFVIGGGLIDALSISAVLVFAVAVLIPATVAVVAGRSAFPAPARTSASASAPASVP